jgi:nicotinate-nucleotide adenylyltransferase
MSWDRAEMLAASIPGDPRLTLDDCELYREGLSYTIDTIKDIIARYTPEGKPGLILGDDLVPAFGSWRSPGEIADLTDIIIARRLPAGSGISREEVNFPYPHKRLNNEIINYSSQEIRKRIKNGKAWRYYVPPGARQIIEDKGLYGFSGSPGDWVDRGEPEQKHLFNKIASIENEVRITLSPEKFFHSRNTALLSWDLCGRFGLDREKGYLAGIAHDLCKTVRHEELLRLAREDGKSISVLEQKKPGLLHARAAAVLVQKNFGIHDRDILEAIRYHTTGIRDMGAIAKVVYIADKIEISRTGVDPALREMGRDGDLDTLFMAVLNNTVTYLKSRQLDISYGTRRLLAAMHERNKQ